MRQIAYVLVSVTFLSASICAQVSPIPVAEKEIRDNTSTKMRSAELQRVKRDATKIVPENLGPASVNKFLEIKEDFERIQKLEGEIITAYTTGKTIDYGRIAIAAGGINESSLQLKKNIFPEENKEKTDTTGKDGKPEAKDENSLPNSIRDLIVILDGYIGSFVDNPLFSSAKKTKPKDLKRAESDLERISLVSAFLKETAEKEAKSRK